jgi:hypothetical protein
MVFLGNDECPWSQLSAFFASQIASENAALRKVIFIHFQVFLPARLENFFSPLLQNKLERLSRPG